MLGVAGCVGAFAVVAGEPLVRLLGLTVLLAGAVLSCLLAWRANRMAQRRREAHALAEALRHAEQLRAERAGQRVVLDALGRRLVALRQRADAATVRSSRLQQEMSTLRGNYEALRVELELQAVWESGAHVVELPRDAAVADPWVTARELWRRDRAAKRPA
ncbi:MAG: hypothetical protein QM582_18665 [Micropruina sp.]|uniref:hypothetical protein n=1 Tax=Micropruina sp. TaxID=2737536 RepID=UPI0039E23849